MPTSRVSKGIVVCKLWGPHSAGGPAIHPTTPPRIIRPVCCVSGSVLFDSMKPRRSCIMCQLLTVTEFAFHLRCVMHFLIFRASAIDNDSARC